MVRKVLSALVLVLVFVSVSIAEVPPTINYQGYLTDDSGYPVTGSFDMTFELHLDPTVHLPIWGEVWNSGTSQVIVTDGYYSVQLGTYSPFTSVFDSFSTLWLQIIIGTEFLSPRKKIASTPFTNEALNADTLDGQDASDFAAVSHGHSFSEITGSVTDAQVPNNITINYAASAGAVPWSGITGMPSGFSDGTDDTGVTTETDPTVPTNLKDGVAFSELSGTATDAQIPDDITIDYATASGGAPWSGISGMPAGFADDIDDIGAVGTPIDSVPVTISTTGYYYFTGNLSTSSTAITITADDVTLDLKGFTLNGNSGASLYQRGVYINGADNVEVRNGTIRNFGGEGVRNDSCHGSRVISVRIYDCGQGGTIPGIRLQGGEGNLVANCTAKGNTGNGIFLYDGNTIRNNIAINNTGTGISVSKNNTVTGNTVYNNGSDGISAGYGSTVSNNTSADNGNNGIMVYYGSGTLINNVAYNNAGQGFYIGIGSVAMKNAARYNEKNGFYLVGQSLVKENVALSNDWNGFLLGSQSLLVNNVSVYHTSGSYVNFTACATCTMIDNHSN